MILLQEGMAAGPYILLFLFIVLGAIALIIYVIYVLVDINYPRKKIKENDSNDKHESIVDEVIDEKNKELKPSVLKIFLMVFLVIVCVVLSSLLKWGCNIRFD